MLQISLFSLNSIQSSNRANVNWINQFSITNSDFDLKSYCKITLLHHNKDSFYFRKLEVIFLLKTQVSKGETSRFPTPSLPMEIYVKCKKQILTYMSRANYTKTWENTLLSVVFRDVFNWNKGLTFRSCCRPRDWSRSLQRWSPLWNRCPQKQQVHPANRPLEVSIVERTSLVLFLVRFWNNNATNLRFRKENLTKP